MLGEYSEGDRGVFGECSESVRGVGVRGWVFGEYSGVLTSERFVFSLFVPTLQHIPKKTFLRC